MSFHMQILYIHVVLFQYVNVNSLFFVIVHEHPFFVSYIYIYIYNYIYILAYCKYTAYIYIYICIYSYDAMCVLPLALFTLQKQRRLLDVFFHGPGLGQRVWSKARGP